MTLASPEEKSRGREESLALSERLAWEALARQDLEAVSARTFSQLLDEDRLSIAFLQQSYLVDRGSREITDSGGNALTQVRRILILHHLCTAPGGALSGKLIGFAEIPGLASYLGPFRARVCARLERAFGSCPKLLLSAAQSLGGMKERFGDCSAKLRLLPRVPVTVVLWQGGEEFASKVEVLFDAGVDKELPLEDIIVGAEQLAKELVGQAGACKETGISKSS
jgi:hypothetical protein